MGLEISKRYSYSFHPMSVKLHEDIGYHGGIEAVTFLDNLPTFTNFVTFGNFKTEINGKIITYSLS